APACVESELEASVEKLFDEGGSMDQVYFAAGGGQEAEVGIATGVRDAGGSSHPRAEREARLLDSTVGHVVPLLPVAPACVESELEASVEKLFDEGGSADQVYFAAGGGQEAEVGTATGVRIVVEENVAAERPRRPRKKRQAITDAGGSSHPRTLFSSQRSLMRTVKLSLLLVQLRFGSFWILSFV
nr:hypothetical protein [Tanacetum cinerariifolium]